MMSRITPCLAIALLALATGGCATQAPTPTLEIIEPAEGQSVAQGGILTLRIEVGNLLLVDPDLHNAGEKGRLLLHPSTDPDADTGLREGHYHVYFDDASGDDPHVTAWTEQTAIAIPADLALGAHTLRVELRDNAHSPYGVEQTVGFTCVAPD